MKGETLPDDVKDLLKETLYALNFHTNFYIMGGKYKTSYELAAQITSCLLKNHTQEYRNKSHA